MKLKSCFSTQEVRDNLDIILALVHYVDIYVAKRDHLFAKYNHITLGTYPTLSSIRYLILGLDDVVSKRDDPEERYLKVEDGRFGKPIKFVN